jgi:hypothetical protein
VGAQIRARRAMKAAERAAREAAGSIRMEGYGGRPPVTDDRPVFQRALR